MQTQISGLIISDHVIFQEPDLFGTVTEALIAQPECAHTATQIVYILSIYGADVNIISQVHFLPLVNPPSKDNWNKGVLILGSVSA